MMQTHRVMPGETLWSIAEHYYGDGSLDVYIFNHNQHIIADINKVYAGQEIVIPHVPRLRWTHE